MTRIRPSLTKPGSECCCGGELKEVPLPRDLQALSGKTSLLVHVESGDTRCYPDSPEDQAATAEPI